MKYCEDCNHFSFVKRDPKDYDFYVCKKKHKMRFKIPSSYKDLLDDDWGFYLPGCSDFEERSKEENCSEETVKQQPWVIYKKTKY